MGFGTLAVGIVSAGSRGAFISLIAGIFALITRPGQSAMRIKVAFIALLTAGCLVWTAYQNDAVRTRWERTFSKGNMSGREKIVPVAWKMFSESPVIGWGTGRLTDELGRRFGKASVDTHNGYLWVLTETGLVGSSPFFVGLVLTWRAAWRARGGAEGSLPLALLTCVLLVNMSLTWHYRKLFWIVLAYALASNTSAALKWQRLRTVAHGSRTILPVGELDVPARR
jgi:O-antigen ligase